MLRPYIGSKSFFCFVPIVYVKIYYITPNPINNNQPTKNQFKPPLLILYLILV